LKKNNFGIDNETLKWIAIIVVILLVIKYLPSIAKEKGFQFDGFSFQAPPTTLSTKNCFAVNIGAEFDRYFSNMDATELVCNRINPGGWTQDSSEISCNVKSNALIDCNQPFAQYGKQLCNYLNADWVCRPDFMGCLCGKNAPNPPVANDFDGDGIPDSTDPDDDNDGWNDDEEIQEGTDPHNPNDYPGSGVETDCNQHCLNNGYISGRAGYDCSSCQPYEVCLSNPYNIDIVCCCIPEEQDQPTTYTCGQAGDDSCTGSCPSDYPYCEKVWFGLYEWACTCTNSNDEVHVDWKPDGINHNPHDETPPPPPDCVDEAALWGYDYWVYNPSEECMWYGYDYCWENFASQYGGGRIDGECCLFDCVTCEDKCTDLGYPGGYYAGPYGGTCQSGYNYVAGTTQCCCMTDDFFCDNKCPSHGVSVATSGTGISYADNWCVVNCGGEGYSSISTNTYDGVNCYCWVCHNEQHEGWTC